METMIEIERISISEKWDLVKYKLDPPREWKQLNLNVLLGGPQKELIQLEINPNYKIN